MNGIISLIGLIIVCAIPAVLIGIATYFVLKVILGVSINISGIDKKSTVERNFDKTRKRLERQAMKRQ